MTVAPLVADGVVITGISGAEYGIRGFTDGWDPDTGKHLWRTYTVADPEDPAAKSWPGDTWQHGGGSLVAVLWSAPQHSEAETSLDDLALGTSTARITLPSP